MQLKNNSIKNGPKIRTDTHSLQNEYTKRCSTSLVIRKIQNKITMRCHYTFMRVSKKVEITTY